MHTIQKRQQLQHDIFRGRDPNENYVNIPKEITQLFFEQNRKRGNFCATETETEEKGKVHSQPLSSPTSSQPKAEWTNFEQTLVICMNTEKLMRSPLRRPGCWGVWRTQTSVQTDFQSHAWIDAKRLHGGAWRGVCIMINERCISVACPCVYLPILCAVTQIASFRTIKFSKLNQTKLN